MRQSGRLALYALAGMATSGLTANPARADEKGDALLRQVRETAHTLTPLVGEYTVTLHDKTGDKTEKYQAQLEANGSGWRGGRMLPQSVFNLFDPVTRVPADTRCLGRKTVDGETYEVVELKLPTLTFQLYIGDDGLIHRAHTTVGPTPASVPIPPINPKTGMPTKTFDEMMAEGVTSPTKTDARAVDVVVTSYRKLRSFTARPELPAPLHLLTFIDPQSGKSGLVLNATLSPDGTRAAILFADNTAKIYDVASGALQAALDAPPSLRAVVFSPDGTRLATSGEGQAVTLWDARTGRRLLGLEGIFSSLPPAWTPDGKRLSGDTLPFTNNSDKLRLWDAETGRALPPLVAQGAACFAFSPDGKRLATLARQGETHRLLLWDAQGKLLHAEPVQTALMARPVFSPDSQWIALAGQKSVLLFSGASGLKQRELGGDLGDISLVQFASDGKTLIAADHDTRGDTPTYRPDVLVWETGGWQMIGQGSVPQNLMIVPFNNLSLSADGKTLAAFDFSKGVYVWAVPGR